MTCESKINSKIVDLMTRNAYKERGPIDTGGGPPDDGDMDARVTKLENFVIDARDRLTHIETRLDQTATKSDLHEASASHIKWVVGTAAALGVAAITVMTFVLNNAVPKAAPSAPTPPIIIYSQPATSPTAVQAPAATMPVK